MQRSRKGWVIDASVAVKWFLRDEEFLREADRFERLVFEGLAEITAPHLSRHEVANALVIACQSGRIAQEAAERALLRYGRMPISLPTDPAWLLQDAFRVAMRFGVAVYDAVYLALARSTGIDLITADRRLRDLVRPSLPFVYWLGEI